MTLGLIRNRAPGFFSGSSSPQERYVESLTQVVTSEDENYGPFKSNKRDLEKPLLLPVAEIRNHSVSILEGEQKNASANARVVSDAIIGLSDGLTVPFALTAGLSALGDTKTVIYAGLAELIAGAISMGLGGYLGAKSERESYEATKSRTRDLMVASPKCVSEAIFDIFTPYNIPISTVNDLTKSLAESPQLLDFLMHFGHVLPEPSGSRPLTCALTIAAGYFIGGLIPLLPYIVVDRHEVILALYWSIVIMFGALFVFGYAKTGITGGWNGRGRVVKGIKAGFQMVIVGGVAAGASMALVRAFEYSSHPP